MTQILKEVCSSARGLTHSDNYNHTDSTQERTTYTTDNLQELIELFEEVAPSWNVQIFDGALTLTLTKDLYSLENTSDLMKKVMNISQKVGLRPSIILQNWTQVTIEMTDSTDGITHEEVWLATKVETMLKDY